MVSAPDLRTAKKPLSNTFDAANAAAKLLSPISAAERESLSAYRRHFRLLQELIGRNVSSSARTGSSNAVVKAELERWSASAASNVMMIQTL